MSEDKMYSMMSPAVLLCAFLCFTASSALDKTKLEAPVAKVKTENSSAVLTAGSTYIRWGRSSCPETSQLVYEGIVGGSHFTHGGASNYVCLPRKPEWGTVLDGFQTTAYMYGTEYDTKFVPIFENKVHDHDVVCALCHVPARTTVMIPALKSCPDSWITEYSGYLMAQYRHHQRSEYICVDKDPIGNVGGQPNKDGALLYFTEAVCGSLPCPRYHDGWELTCSVCSK